MEESILDKILLHLYESIDAGFSYRMKKGLYIDSFFLSSNWNKFEKEKIKKGIDSLRKSGFIIKKDNSEGLVSISLSERGKIRALNLRFRRLNNKEGENWDKKWRMVYFDIPEDYRKGRDALRYRLRTAGFYKLQESIFIFPYECEREIRDFIKLFKMEKYVKFALIDFIDDGERVAKLFKLK